MKKILFSALCIALFNFYGFSQKVDSARNTEQTSTIKSVQAQTFKKIDYSVLSLRQSSIDNLYLLLNKAKTRKTTGLIMTCAGPVLFGAGLVMEIGWIEGSGAVLATGAISTAAGIPILIAGSKKVKRIRTELNNRNNRASLNIAPGIVHTDNDKKIYPGATFSVSF